MARLWLSSSGQNENCCPYLARYMGHADMVSTDYYLHLVPEFFHTFAEKVRSTEGVLPEVDYEGE